MNKTAESSSWNLFMMTSFRFVVSQKKWKMKQQNKENKSKLGLIYWPRQTQLQVPNDLHQHSEEATKDGYTC